MEISLDWIGDYVDLPREATGRELASQLTLKTVEVENVLDLGAALRGVVVGRVVEAEPAAAAGLAVRCTIDAGRLLTVVTRATNLAPGATVAVALPGAQVSGREITPIEVDGVISEAYICRAADLGLARLYPPAGPGDALVLDHADALAGSSIAEVLLWQDTVLEIDNKSLTNRPDLWGHHGLAREFAAILGLPLSGPVLGPKAARPATQSGLIGAIDPAVCRRMVLVEFELDIRVPSPLWLRSRLARIGEASVNLPVDLGNYVMFATGQPVHIYDAESVELPLSVAIQAEPQKLDLLDGQCLGLPAGSPVVVDQSGPVALAGIMGGLSSAVTTGSRRFILEAATFAPQAIRRAAQRTGLRTEAAARFEKGLDTQRVDQAIDLYLTLLERCAPTSRARTMQDLTSNPTQRAAVDVEIGFLARRIGIPLETDRVKGILESLGFLVRTDGTTLATVAPTWRSTGDVSIPDDVLEEVARILGYEEIPAAALAGTLIHLPPGETYPLDRRIREQLAARAGMQEVITYPWSADKMLEAAGYQTSAGVGIEGAPAPDRGTLRPGLIPNLLEAVSGNLRFGSSFSLFEVGTVYDGTSTSPWANRFEMMPGIDTRAAAMLVGADGRELFRRAKGVLEMLVRACRIVDLRFGSPDDAVTPLWADRQVQMALIASGRQVGTLALLSTRCRRLAGIEDSHVACFEVDLCGLAMHPTRENAYQPVPEWPESDFDLSVVVPEATKWTQIAESAESAGRLVHKIAFVDEFRGSWVPEGCKSVTLRVTLRPDTGTLTSGEITAVREEVLAALARDLDAHLRE
jgi:phenylalanyl-tRNA synthetase beta chain